MLIDAAALTLQKIELENAQARSVAGTLTSNPSGLDHKVESLTVSFTFSSLFVSIRFHSCSVEVNCTILWPYSKSIHAEPTHIVLSVFHVCSSCTHSKAHMHEHLYCGGEGMESAVNTQLS